MKFAVTVFAEVEADCSRAALARVLACVSQDLGECDVEVEPDDGTLEGDFVFESHDTSEQEG